MFRLACGSCGGDCFVNEAEKEGLKGLELEKEAMSSSQRYVRQLLQVTTLCSSTGTQRHMVSGASAEGQKYVAEN